MDFLNKALAQASELFRSMTVGARITAGLLLAVVVISLVYLFRYQTSSPDLDLMNGVALSANDITAMEAAFAAANLNSYEVQGNRIRVPRGQKSLYIAAAADKKAIPNDFFRYLDEAVNGSGGFLETRQQREERIKLGKQKELSEIIGGMHGIERARVFWDAETTPGLNPTTTKTALVSVKPTGSASLDESQVASIRRLVAGAIAGMKDTSVKVVDESTGRTFFGDTDGGAGSMDDPYYGTKQVAEQRWTAHLLSALSYVRGGTGAVNVELEKELRRLETEVKPDQKPVVAKTTEKSLTRTQEGAASGGRAGFQANQPQALAATPGKGPREEVEESTQTVENALGSTSVEKETPGLTPTLVTASIGVPTSHFEAVWRQRNPAQPGEASKAPTQADLDQVRTAEITKIKSAVLSLLPPSEKTTDPTQLVTVTEFQDITPEPVSLPGLPQRTLDWLVRNWSVLGLTLLALFSLMVLRSMAKSMPAVAPRPFAAEALAAAGSAVPAPVPQEAEKVETPADRRLRRFAAGGPSLRDELSELVTEDPDAAANILRTWIGSVK